MKVRIRADWRIVIVAENEVEAFALLFLFRDGKAGERLNIDTSIIHDDDGMC